MKLKEITSVLRKDFIYELYCDIAEHPKQYERITRNKMIDEIIITYSNPQNICDYLTIKEIRLLKSALKNNNQIESTDSPAEYSLHSKLLLTYDYLTYEKNKVIPEELVPFIKEAIKMCNLPEIKKRDELNDVIHGMINIYGVIEINDFIDILQNYYPDKSNDELYQYLKKENSLKNLIRIEDDQVINNDEYMDDETIDNILDTKDNISQLDYKIYPVEQVRKMANREFKNYHYNKFIKYLKKNLYYYQQDFILEGFYTCLNNFIDIEDYFEWLYDRFYNTDIDMEELTHLFEEAYYSYPCPILKGNTINDTDIESLVSSLNEPLIQTDACLNTSDVDLFFKVYLGLLEYANKKLRVTNIKKIYQHINLPPDKLVTIRDSLFKNHRDVIDSFIVDNPYNFNEDELEIVDEFKKGICDDCIVIEHRDDCTIVGYRDNNCYKVKGLRSNMSDVIPAPAMAEMLLLPFKNVIVYDGMISAYPISMGSGMLKMIEQIAKQEPLSQITGLLS